MCSNCEGTADLPPLLAQGPALRHWAGLFVAEPWAMQGWAVDIWGSFSMGCADAQRWSPRNHSFWVSSHREPAKMAGLLPTMI